MQVNRTIKRSDHLGFKGNLKSTRYGWLRLTPAYSVHLVSEVLDNWIYDNSLQEDLVVLDPFCGTGTTALVCAERGVTCDTTDINPFLLWLGRAKTCPYSAEDMAAFKISVLQVAHAIRTPMDGPLWSPPLHQIEKWWDEQTLNALARAIHTIIELSSEVSEGTLNLLKIAFCQTMIDLANVSFGHQSMSFKQIETLTLFSETQEDMVADKWRHTSSQVAETAQSSIVSSPRFLYGDARNLPVILEADRYSCVITSPPYPNRISYIRELRPYMYWLNYLNSAKEAGALDWQAIGGTWGCATSNLTRWEPDPDIEVPFESFTTILERIAHHSPLLSRYVHKYFHDMVLHCNGLFQVVRSGGTVTYIVGNSKFYDVMLPVEDIFAALFLAAGFEGIDVRVIRKRSSKKELFEFAISARKP
jgi:hypothetical protein